MIFLVMARPMPVPGQAVRSCRRWKMTKIRSSDLGSIPMPWSVNENSQKSPSGRTVICTRGGSPPPNFSALLSRFWNTAVTKVLNDLPGHGQADAGTRGGGPLVQALEDDENPVGVLRFDPDAVVGEREQPEVPVRADRDLHPRRLAAAGAD